MYVMLGPLSGEGLMGRTPAGHGHGAPLLGESHLCRGLWLNTVPLGSGTPTGAPRLSSAESLPGTGALAKPGVGVGVGVQPPSGVCGFCIANQTRTFWCLRFAKCNFLFLREKD